ncbi:enoyl-CoA hydratase-related protein [Gordonia sp. PKS22-38]|uniref:Enoyl-CoA hydratase-related protein n=1 Tax=Gordonia prachuapensis TaxID=3115651 RepID=A0ABU7MPH1_9ACTN|nr:enoyl-CoA hydratase-related protein [Gordonia sp. PKS22-38]
MSDAHISYESHDGIGTITIDRPAKKNAMTFAMLGELSDAVAEGIDDDGARALILTGVPGAFCAGTDLSDLQDTPEEQRSSGGQAPRAGGVPPLMACPKPIVCAIDGPAIGMGAEFTSMCDVRIATPRARFGWVFVHRGLVPDTGAGTWVLPRLIGVQEAARLLFSGEIIGAERAIELGYLLAVVEPDDLDAAAREEAGRFIAGSPFAIRETKALLYAGIGRSFDEHVGATREVMERCFRSEDHREGVASFLERRPPNFTGR